MKKHKNEPLTFFNCLQKKYDMKGVTKGDYDWSKATHRTRPHEIRYIASMNMRSDLDLITSVKPSSGPPSKETPSASGLGGSAPAATNA